MSVCAKFQLSSLSRSGWKVCGGGGGGLGGVVEHVTTVSNSNASCFRVELSCVGFDNDLKHKKVHAQEIPPLWCQTN